MLHRTYKRQKNKKKCKRLYKQWSIIHFLSMPPGGRNSSICITELFQEASFQEASFMRVVLLAVNSQPWR